MSDSGASPVLKLAVPNREILVGTPDDPFGRVDMPASIAAVILDGMLERTGRPSRLLGEALPRQPAGARRDPRRHREG